MARYKIRHKIYKKMEDGFSVQNIDKEVNVDLTKLRIKDTEILIGDKSEENKIYKLIPEDMDFAKEITDILPEKDFSFELDTYCVKTNTLHQKYKATFIFVVTDKTNDDHFYIEDYVYKEKDYAAFCETLSKAIPEVEWMSLEEYEQYMFLCDIEGGMPKLYNILSEDAYEVIIKDLFKKKNRLFKKGFIEWDPDRFFKELGNTLSSLIINGG